MTTSPGDRHGRTRRRRWLWATCAAVLVGSTAAAGWIVLHDSDSAAADGSGEPAATATVGKRTIAKTETWDGTIGRNAPFDVVAAGSGTLTRIAEQGTTVRRGTELFWLDEDPVVALMGQIPMYRELSNGAEGRDVREFERNLSALGYDGFTPDDEFTAYTALAVREWQDDLGVDETGTVGPGDVVFLPGPGRIGTVAVEVGTPVAPGTQTLDVTDSAQIVELEGDPADRDLVPVGTKLHVQLPGGGRVPATVSESSVVEDSEATGGESGTGADETTLQVVAELDKRVDNSLMGSPVDVELVVEKRKNVLAAPIAALLALAEGGYGLEVVGDDGSTELVPVETGLFADGTVEVSGKGIEKGTVVGVAGE